MGNLENGLDSAYNFLLAFFNQSATNLTPTCITLLNIFFSYQIYSNLIKNANEIPFMRILFSLLKYGIIHYFITNYNDLVKTVQESFIKLGAIATGESSFVLSLNDIWGDYKVSMLDPLANNLKSFGITTVGPAIMCILCIGALTLIILFICVNIFIVQLEFAIVVYLGIVFLPFYMFDGTSFIGEVWFKTLINQSLRYMVLVFLICLTIMKLPNSFSADLTDPLVCLGFAGSIFALALICYKVPALMSSVISGSPSLGQNGTLSNLAKRGAAKAASVAASAAASGAKAAGSGIKTVASKAASFIKKG